MTLTETGKKSDIWCLSMALLIAAVLTGFLLCLILLFTRRKVFGLFLESEGIWSRMNRYLTEGKD